MPVDHCFADFLGDPRNEVRPPPEGIAIAKVRRAANAFMLLAPRPAIHSVDALTAEGPGGPVSLRLYRPDASGGLPVIVFFHGGGFVWGDLDTHDGMCRSLAIGARAAVIAVDYRLAPETRFPGPLEDCHAALRWTAAEAGNLGLDPSRIAVCGDSAGGNLALAAALLARERGPALRHVALIYPTVDPRCASRSQAEFARGHMLTRDALRWFWNCYLGDEQDAPSPLAALLTADLRGLPPAFVATAEYDPLRDEGEALADRLEAAGSRVSRRRYAGMIHGFAGMPQFTPAAGQAVRDAAAAVQAAFAP